MIPEAHGSGFPSREKLKSRKSIQYLFEHGSSMVQWPVRVIFRFNRTEGTEKPLVKTGVSVPKKTTAKAHRRNRIKRLMREVYRVQKSPLLETCSTKQLSLEMMWVFTGKEEPEYHLLYDTASKILQKLIKLASAPVRD